MNDTLLASASRVLWRLIKAEGEDADAIFEEAGLDTDLINQSSARYPTLLARQAWNFAAKKIKSPSFGLRAGAHWLPSDLHALGYAFLASKTLEVGLHRIALYNEVVDQVIHFIVTEDAEHLFITYENMWKTLPDIPALEDARWSIVLTMCRAAMPEGVSPVRVELTHGSMKCRTEYETFFGCPVIFSQQRSVMSFRRADVEKPLTGVNLELAAINEKALKGYLDYLHEDYLQRRVAYAITEQLASGNLSDDSVAEALFMSSRTLQRKLSIEGTTFKQILESVREKLAIEYIRDKRLSLSEISYLLGFKQQSSFTRAFKRWTGISPAQQRKASN